MKTVWIWGVRMIWILFIVCTAGCMISIYRGGYPQQRTLRDTLADLAIYIVIIVTGAMVLW